MDKEILHKKTKKVIETKSLTSLDEISINQEKLYKRLSLNQINFQYSDETFQENLLLHFSLCKFFRNAIYYNNANLGSRMSKLIHFTETGILWKNIFLTEFAREYTEENIDFSLYIQFHFNDLLIDIKKTDSTKIFELLSEEILNKRILYPNFYSTEIYDKFFEEFKENLHELTTDQTLKLIGDFENGVFQINNIISGPLGLTISLDSRYFPPKILNFPLWHCSEPHCKKHHNSRLDKGNEVYFEILGKFLRSKENLRELSPFADFFMEKINNNFYDERKFESTPLILSCLFDENEIKIIFVKLANTYSKEIRKNIPNRKKYQNIFKNPSEIISKKLTKNECIQLMLTLKDEVLIENIEYLIEEKKIIIPITEIRKPWLDTHSSFLKKDIEVTHHGFRIKTGFNHFTMIKLKKMILFIYETEELKQELFHTLRFMKGNSLIIKLDQFIYQNDPFIIIQDLIFRKQKLPEKLFSFLKFGYFPKPKNEQEEKKLIKKILWKLGFPVKEFNKNLSNFWRYLREFKTEIGKRTSLSEEDKEIIRKAGVNLWVSLEDILSRSLSFCTWMCLSDHYNSTNFTFNPDAAKEFMISKLNNKKDNQGNSINFKNLTLYPLIFGFNLLANICKEIQNNRIDYNRNKSEFPKYSSFSEIFSFQFLNNIFFLNVNQTEIDQMINNFEDISNRLNLSTIYSVRNGLDHYRSNQTFPNPIEMEKLCQILNEVVKKIENLGYFPMIFHLKEFYSDEYGRNTLNFVNYSDTQIKCRNPSSLIELPNLKNNIILVPSIHIGNSNDIIRFEYHETSDYSKFWQNYPKKRKKQ